MPLDLALDLAHALDPVAFVQDRLKFEPDPWQARLLRSCAPWILLNCCRQSGKSTTTAAVALHTALYDPGLILLVSPSLRQSKELFAKVTGFLKDLEPAEVLEEDNKSCCTLANGARLISLPRRPRHAARLLRAKADHQRRSRLCERRDAGGARPDARRLKGPTDRDVLAQRQAGAFLRELAARRRGRADQDHRPGMPPDRPGVSRKDAPETRADAVRAGIRRRVHRCGELGFFELPGNPELVIDFTGV